ncbi:hypothetical protein V8C44DRAFT_314637 [Trichoderma aethiopicum]
MKRRRVCKTRLRPIADDRTSKRIGSNLRTEVVTGFYFCVRIPFCSLECLLPLPYIDLVLPPPPLQHSGAGSALQGETMNPLAEKAGQSERILLTYHNSTERTSKIEDSVLDTDQSSSSSSSRNLTKGGSSNPTGGIAACRSPSLTWNPVSVARKGSPGGGGDLLTIGVRRTRAGNRMDRNSCAELEREKKGDRRYDNRTTGCC